MLPQRREYTENFLLDRVEPRIPGTPAEGRNRYPARDDGNVNVGADAAGGFLFKKHARLVNGRPFPLSEDFNWSRLRQWILLVHDFTLPQAVAPGPGCR